MTSPIELLQLRCLVRNAEAIADHALTQWQTATTEKEASYRLAIVNATALRVTELREHLSAAEAARNTPAAPQPRALATVTGEAAQPVPFV
jgi:hypothetical protein